MGFRQSPTRTKRCRNQRLDIGLVAKRHYAWPQRIGQVGFALDVKPCSGWRLDRAERVSHGEWKLSRAAPLVRTKQLLDRRQGSSGKICRIALPGRLIESCPMTHALTWRRTKIGGVELRNDFCAFVDGNVNVARIYKMKRSRSHIVWSCNMSVSGDSGSVLTRREAIAWVEKRLVRFAATNADIEPQAWAPDERSGQLRRLRHENPDAYAELVEDLRCGKVARMPLPPSR